MIQTGGLEQSISESCLKNPSPKRAFFAADLVSGVPGLFGNLFSSLLGLRNDALQVLRLLIASLIQVNQLIASILDLEYKRRDLSLQVILNSAPASEVSAA